MITSRKNWCAAARCGTEEGGGKSGRDRMGPGPLGRSPTATPVQGGAACPSTARAHPSPSPAALSHFPVPL